MVQSNIKGSGAPRNYKLKSGVVRFGVGKMYHKKAIYKFLKKTTQKKICSLKPSFVEKKIGGAKNGKSRIVRTKKLPKNYDTYDNSVTSAKSFFSKHLRRVRPSLSAGTVAIILAGNNKGKRVVVLKTMETGLLLVTGPFKVNGCPLRRINQRFLLATSTRIDITNVKIPKKLDDQYFRRIKSVTSKKEENIFEKKKNEYILSEERRKDQADLDKEILLAIKKHPEGAMLKSYLRNNFSLSKGQYVHKLAF